MHVSCQVVTRVFNSGKNIFVSCVVSSKPTSQSCSWSFAKLRCSRFYHVSIVSFLASSAEGSYFFSARPVLFFITIFLYKNECTLEKRLIHRSEKDFLGRTP